MQQKSDKFLDKYFVQISRFKLFLVVSLLVVTTFLGMTLLLLSDLELFFRADDVAIKVGGTLITFDQLNFLKNLSGPAAASITDQEFSKKLVENLLFAEAGRVYGLDNHNSFLNLVRVLDAATPSASDPYDLSRAIFLIEKLANITREHLLKSVPISSVEFSSEQLEESVVPGFALHIRTILVPDIPTAELVLRQAEIGIPFEELNSRWSKSPYAGVKGDLGWITPQNLPQGVFEKLQSLPIGSMTIGFKDDSGVHLFLLEGKPNVSQSNLEKMLQTRKLKERQEKILANFLSELKQKIPIWINPSLIAIQKHERK